MDSTKVLGQLDSLIDDLLNDSDLPASSLGSMHTVKTYCLGLLDRHGTDSPRSGNGILAAESAIREYDVTEVPWQLRSIVLITSAGVAPDPTKQDVIDSDFHQRDRGIDPGGGADVAVRVGPGLSSQVASERAGSPGRAGSGGRLAADRASGAVRSRGPGRGHLRRHSCRGLRRFLDAGVPRAADRRFRDQTRSHDRR